MTLGVDGLVSGLDTSALINSLIKADAVPQTLLKRKVSSIESFSSALQKLNSLVATATSAAGELAKPESFAAYTTTASSDSIIATATKDASAGSLTVTATQLAQKKVGVTAAMTEWTAGTTLTIARDGENYEITAASTSLDDVVSAINDSDAGVTAVKVSAGTDGSGTAQYRLQLVSDDSGAANDFTLYSGTAASVEGGTASDVLAEPGAAIVQSARDAIITLWAGSTAEQQLTSSTNTFEGVLDGVDLTLNEASEDPVTITVDRDDAAITDRVGEFIASINDALSNIATNSAVTTGTDDKGNATATGGTFTSHSTIMTLNQSLLSAVMNPIDGRSPSQLGISLNDQGGLDFDAEAFSAALADDPDRVQATIQEIAGRVEATGSSASDKYDGTLTRLIQRQDSQVRDLGEQISDWDSRLADRRAFLERTYAALEVQLGRLNSQSSWLSSQLATLPKVGS